MWLNRGIRNDKVALKLLVDSVGLLSSYNNRLCSLNFNLYKRLSTGFFEYMMLRDVLPFDGIVPRHASKFDCYGEEDAPLTMRFNSFVYMLFSTRFKLLIGENSFGIEPIMEYVNFFEQRNYISF